MLTIVIPTRDRSPFLIRLLSYWADLGFPYPILIGDSSVSPHCEEAQRAIGHFSGRLTLRYRKFPTYRELGPGEGTIQCMNGLLEEVDTPYVIFVADDDFVVPDALREAVHFLEQHPDYSAVVGESGFMTVSGGPHGRIQEVWRYPQFALEEPQARQRLLRYLKNTFTTEHAIKRTPQMQAQWKAAKDLPMNNRF
ncbi:MAG: TIGR00180 family glycosyltransferase, partial [Candidatus Omnitrophica bacterium]|nr:TIGR00180 family glycosyltransferase [Candidatus Omnitrophota bacterium]